MTTRKRRSSRRRHMLYRNSREESNPMESLLNLSDIMLVLAVGIMLALVLHWNVPLVSAGDGSENGGIGQSAKSDSDAGSNQPSEAAGDTVPDAILLNKDDLLETSRIPDGSMKIGSVYYDEKTGYYYILQE